MIHPTLELAALHYDFFGCWARPKQLIPEHRWSSHGIMTGRGFGKTLCHTNMLLELVLARRAMWIGLIAQNEDECIKTLVEGPSGVLLQSPPWFKATYASNVVTWPNGAQAFVYTPEAPNAIRGPDLDVVYATEMAAWPKATMLEAWSNCDFVRRRGEALLLWDSTPKRQHPIIRELLQAEKHDPKRNIIMRGSSIENAANLPPGKIDEWRRKYGTSLKGREEIDGEYVDESDGAKWKSGWIRRRGLPDRWQRRILAIDPATTDNPGSDETGMVDLGLMLDGIVRVNRDHTCKISWDDWGDLAVRQYMQHKMSLVVIETNRGGDACIANIRRAAVAVGATTVKLGKDDKPPNQHNHTVIYVREVYAKQGKDFRADPVAGCYSGGMVLHADDSNLERNPDRPNDESLENTMLTWDPAVTKESPNDVDALVHGVWELLDLGRDMPDKGVMKGLQQANTALRPAAAADSPVARDSRQLIQSLTLQHAPRSPYAGRYGRTI